jgi:uncharacterized protein YrzB (UPF0473 family)
MAENMEMELNEEEEAAEQYITLTEDDGNDVSFEILGTTEYKDRLFAVLLPFEDEEGDEVVILEMLPTENDDEFDFVSVDDDSLLGEVFEVFKKEYDGEYDFQ